MSSLLNDMAGKSAEPSYLFDAGRGCFWKEMTGEWIELREGAMRRELMKRGKNAKAEAGKGMISEVDDIIREIEQTQRVRRAIEVAGWRTGVQQMGPDRILVPRSAQLVAEMKGEWLLTMAYLEGIFRGWEKHFSDKGDEVREDVVDQRDHVFAWLQHWLNSLYAGTPTNGLGLHVAGEPECGKTRFSAWCKELSGGRVGKPYRYMIGRDDFNRELVEASLQLVDDEQADTTREARKEFGAQWKMFTANEDFKMRGMHADGFNLRACWRLLVLTNLQEQALQVMPQITADLRGKVLQLKGYTRAPLPAVGDVEGWKKYRERYPALAAWWDWAIAHGKMSEADVAQCWPMPMPTGNPAQQAAFWGQIRGELPAFVFWLRNVYAAPSHVAGGRFGVRDWQHPEILRALQAFAPHVRFFQLVERSEVVWRKCVDEGSSDRSAVFEDVDVWTGPSAELEMLLKSDRSKLSRHEKEREIPAANYVGARLTEAMEAWGREVVADGRNRKSRFWTIHRRPDLIA